MPYAAGKNAWGISDRSGRRYRLREMKVEWTGAKVGPDEFETKQPQLSPPQAFPDPQALLNPRPESDLPQQRAIQQGWNPVGFAGIPGLSPPSNLQAVGSVGIAVVSTPVNKAVTGVEAFGLVGSIIFPTPGGSPVSVTGVLGTGGAGSVTVSTTSATTYTVTVQSYGGGNRYYIDGTRQPTLSFSEGSTYIFNWSAATGHPLRFSTTSDGTHGGGSEYTTGVTIDTSAYTSTITLAVGAPTLFYYCQYHSQMGGQINTP
mgnify:FL=1|tara:strand:- start:874 stop:1653 length:780 start_codon:yes stop_codon:yes gene_type:complete